MSSKRRNNVKICPECGSRLESVQKKTVKDGIVYLKKILECVECGYSNFKKDKKDKISIRDW